MQPPTEEHESRIAQFVLIRDMTNQPPRRINVVDMLHVAELYNVIRERGDIRIRGGNRANFYLVQPDGGVVPKDSFVKDMNVKLRSDAELTVLDYGRCLAAWPFLGFCVPGLSSAI